MHWPLFLQLTSVRIINTTISELIHLAGVSVLVCAVITLPVYNGEKLDAAVHPGKTTRGTLTLNERFAYAGLLTTGFGVVDEFSWPDGVSLGTTELVRCAGNASTIQFRDGKLYLDKATLAVVAAEMYNRDRTTRNIEFVIGNIYEWISGETPNFSYGAAQIRLSLAKRLLEGEISKSLSTNEVVDILKDDCNSIQLARAYIEEIAEKLENNLSVDSALRQIAARYIGARESDVYIFGRYIDVISTMYALMKNPTNYTGLAETDEGRQSEEFVVPYYCIGFPRGRVEGEKNSHLETFLNRTSKDQVGTFSVRIWTEEKAPKRYGDLLESARVEWLKTSLTSLNFRSLSGGIANLQAKEASDLREEVPAESDIVKINSECSGIDASFALIEFAKRRVAELESATGANRPIIPGQTNRTNADEKVTSQEPVPVPGKASSSSPLSAGVGAGSSLPGPIAAEGSTKEFVQYLHYDMPGQDLASARGISLDKCASRCRETKGCVGYSFDRWNQFCVLKSLANTFAFNPRSVSGVRAGIPAPTASANPITIERHKEKGFTDEPWDTKENLSKEQCEQFCSTKDDCVAFTYVRAESKCKLFNDTREYYPEVGSDSGIKMQLQ